MARVVAAVAVALAATGAPAHAKPSSRTASEPYQHAALGAPEVFGYCWTVYRRDQPAENHGCVRFQVGARERYVALDVADASGLPVAGIAAQDRDHDGTNDVEFRFCGSVEGQKVVDGELIVWLPMATTVNVTCPGHATTGKVTATFRTPR